MADVARRRTIGSRAAGRSRHHSGNGNSVRSHRSTSSRHSISPEDIRYAMDVVLQPPPTAWAGYELNRTIVVRLRTTNTDPNDALADSTNLVAVATLVPGPNSTGSRDPTVLNSLLAGRRCDSIHPFSDDEADGVAASLDMDHPRGVGYMVFPGLIIRQPGTYRIRITLIRIRSTSSDLPVSPSSGGASVQVVDSNPIVVQGNGPFTNLAPYNGDGEEDDGGWLDVLRTIQTRRRSRD
ncbi:uncharacterized protein BDR25DRAFT_229088 [Lindgomyces ingoldianus]|uniref:Uncharacterized protein n=1 Tax=Lindgomyces ingoldianus TaxID=673940 RepID=A0ACB6QRA5_9PLEO|nr:uncharacterized protein BDR25DRAFT_229088 [Lindgomyces ingoldianus]KAF2469436.1 hypothetical protein BDR25DRAFT_229088 [Lindgomyces ingoldianus]